MDQQSESNGMWIIKSAGMNEQRAEERVGEQRRRMRRVRMMDNLARQLVIYVSWKVKVSRVPAE